MPRSSHCKTKNQMTYPTGDDLRSDSVVEPSTKSLTTGAVVMSIAKGGIEFDDLLTRRRSMSDAEYETIETIVFAVLEYKSDRRVAVVLVQKKELNAGSGDSWASAMEVLRGDAESSMGDSSSSRTFGGLTAVES